MKVVRQRFYFVAFFAVEFTIITNAADSDHFFCGSTWGDASNNCDDRQHCPGGTDDECSTEGHICFGGTSCNSKLGHGNKFTYADVDYNDISNTRFCGAGWNAAVQGCSIQTHCPSGFSDECPTGHSCYGGLDCNVQDFYAEEAEKEAQTPVGINNIGKDDERRNMFCGTNWADANKKCMVWSVSFALQILFALLSFLPLLMLANYCKFYLSLNFLSQYATHANDTLQHNNIYNLNMQ